MKIVNPLFILVNMKLLFVLFVLFAFWGCSSESQYVDVINNERILYVNNVKCKLNAIKEFKLDEETVYDINYSQFIETDSASFLTFLNNYNHSIYFYDYNTSEFYKKTFQNIFDRQKEKIQGYYITSNDTTFYYSYYTGNLYCCNNLEILSFNKINKVDKSSFDLIYPYPYCSTSSPLMKYLDKIITTGWVTGETPLETSYNRPVLTIFDYKTDTLNFVVNYPDIYNKYNWAGGFTYRLPYYDLAKESVVISFSAVHYLVEYSLSDGKETSHYAGSEKIDKISSFPYPQDKSIDENKAWDWYMTTPSYEGVFYDKYKNCYYRIAKLPVINYNNKNRKSNKPVVVVVLDDNLQYLGEASLPTNIQFNTMNSFVSKDGFNIQVITNDEDKLTFYQYVFTEEEK